MCTWSVTHIVNNNNIWSWCKMPVWIIYDTAFVIIFQKSYFTIRYFLLKANSFIFAFYIILQMNHKPMFVGSWVEACFLPIIAIQSSQRLQWKDCPLTRATNLAPLSETQVTIYVWLYYLFFCNKVDTTLYWLLKLYVNYGS